MHRFTQTDCMVRLLPGLLSLVMGSGALRAADLADFGWRHMGWSNQIGSSRPLMLILATFPGDLYNPTQQRTFLDNLYFGASPPQQSVAGYFQDVSYGRFSWTRAGITVLSLPSSQNLSNYQASAGEKPGAHLYWSNIVHWGMVSIGDSALGAFDTNRDHIITPNEVSLGLLAYDGGAGTRTPGDGTVQPPGFVNAWSGLIVWLDYRLDFMTICHEVAHLLGAIDLYGIWGAQSLNSVLTTMGPGASFDPANANTYFNRQVWHLDPWHKLQLGWIEPRLRSLRSPASETLFAAQSWVSSGPLLLFDPVRGTQEFFLLEYRTSDRPNQPNYDADVIEDGLAIWHVRHDGQHNAQWLADAMFPNGEPNWFFCKKCRGLFFLGDAQSPNPDRGVCPASGAHEESVPYRLVVDDPTVPGQRNWRLCHQCQGLFFHDPTNPTAGNYCPSNGFPHSASGSRDYTLISIPLPGPMPTQGDVRWRRCGRCKVLFMRPASTNEVSVCPRDGEHSEMVTRAYALPIGNQQFAVGAEAAPDLLWGHNALWKGGTVTPYLRWYDGTPTRVRISVRPFARGDESITVEWPAQDEAWVDFAYVGADEDGTFDFPYNTVAEGTAAVAPGGVLWMKTGRTAETARIAKAMRIQAYGGPVTIGR